MSRETQVPAIPAPSDSNVIQALQAIKSALDVREGRLGDPLDQFVSLRELKALGLVKDGSSSTITVGGTGKLPVIGTVGSGVFGPDPYDETTDLTTPPAPTGLTATATLTNVYLAWTGAAYSNHAYTEVWRSETNVLGNAVMVGTTIGSIYQDPVRENTTYYYWIRFVSMANVIGPYNSTNGTQVTTGQDPARLLQILTGQITESQLYNTLGDRINLIDGPSSLAGSVAARVLAEELARIAADNSLGSSITTLQNSDATQATQITSLTTRTTNAESSIVSLQNTTANQATSISQLTSSVNGNTTSIQTLTSTTNGLSAQYTVKVDNNGYVSGFGLASTSNNGTPTSSFIIRADSFAIASPSGPGVSPSIPFIVRTTGTTINGEYVGPGVYIDSAWIQNGTLNSAHIVSLTADKITSGTITAAIDLRSPVVRSGAVNPGNPGFYLGDYGGVNRFYIGNGSTGINGRSLEFNGTDAIVRGGLYAYFGTIGGILIDANGISSANYISGSTGFSMNTSGAAEFTNISLRGLTVYNNSGQVILSSGSGIPASAVSGLGSLATQNSVNANQVSGLGSLATQNSVNWNTQLVNVPSFGNFAYLNTITSANISTYIDSAAIGTAYIANAAITSAKIGDAEVGTLKIGGNAVTVPIYGSSFVNYGSFTPSWQTVQSMVVPVSGLLPGEYIGLIVNSVSSIYPADSVVTDVVLGIFINGVLVTELAASIDYYGFSHAGAGYALVPNGSNIVEFKYRSNANKTMTIATYATALAGKR